MSKAVLVALVAAAVVAVLIPVCTMSMCGPTGADGMMGGGIGSLLDCEHMYFPSDAPSALVVSAFALLVAFVALFLFTQEPLAASTAAVRFEPIAPDDPDPPGDPLSGRLRL